MAQVKNINMTPDTILPYLKLSQYDVGREISFVMKDGSEEYTVPSGATVKLEGTKPSGFGFTITCEVNGSTATAVTTAGMTDEWGTVVAELVVRQGDNRLGSSNVRFDIERSPHPEGTTDGSAEVIISELTILVERAEAAAESVHSLTVSSQTLDASEQAYANYDEENNHIEFGIPKGYNGYEIEGTIGFADSSSNGDIVITMS
ncbi:MAG: hypothetical protein IKG44_00290 [Mogibacterium sp.]|nr:hypothetical protein [Mogibacterium sp.]